MITRHDIAFMVQEIISECHSRPKGAEMIDLIDKYADKFGKDNNALVPLDELLVAKELHWIEGINSNPKLRERAWEICHEKSDYIQRSKMLCAKFGKDNSGTVLDEDDFAEELYQKFKIATESEFSTWLVMSRYIIRKFSQQPPKQDNNEFGHSGDKTVSSYPEDNQQPPKERKVSLEEIDLRVLLSNYDGSYHRDSDYIRGLSKAILSLINATEERKGSDELDKAKDHIMFLLPMAKGYAYPKNIKANLEMIKNAEEFIKPNIN